MKSTRVMMRVAGSFFAATAWSAQAVAASEHYECTNGLHLFQSTATEADGGEVVWYGMRTGTDGAPSHDWNFGFDIGRWNLSEATGKWGAVYSMHDSSRFIEILKLEVSCDAPGRGCQFSFYTFVNAVQTSIWEGTTCNTVADQYVPTSQDVRLTATGERTFTTEGRIVTVVGAAAISLARVQTLASPTRHEWLSFGLSDLDLYGRSLTGSLQLSEEFWESTDGRASGGIKRVGDLKLFGTRDGTVITGDYYRPNAPAQAAGDFVLELR